MKANEEQVVCSSLSNVLKQHSFWHSVVQSIKGGVHKKVTDSVSPAILPQRACCEGRYLSTLLPAAASPMSPNSTAFGTALYSRRRRCPEYIVDSVSAAITTVAGIQPSLQRGCTCSVSAPLICQTLLCRSYPWLGLLLGCLGFCMPAVRPRSLFSLSGTCCLMCMPCRSRA